LSTLGEQPSQWRGTGAFEVSYERINCFHSAVVVEAHAPRLHELIEGSDLDADTFLPHLTIATTTEAHAPADLQELLVTLRERQLGTGTASEAKRVRFPAARTTLLQPWEVVETIRF
jgi:beta-phosphoglucomutase-like phosphatase (HAD superfamily)